MYLLPYPLVIHGVKIKTYVLSDIFVKSIFVNLCNFYKLKVMYISTMMIIDQISKPQNGSFWDSWQN